MTDREMAVMASVAENASRKAVTEVLDKIKAEFQSKADSDNWYHVTDAMIWDEAIEIIDKYKAESEDKE